jgi:hypothetical protein
MPLTLTAAARTMRRRCYHADAELAALAAGGRDRAAQVPAVVAEDLLNAGQAQADDLAAAQPGERLR